MSVVATRPQTAGTCRLYLRCLLWGIATGAATGVVTVAVLGLKSVLSGQPDDALVGVLLLGALYGAIVGAIVSIIPSLLGGLFMVAVLHWRHPHPASSDAVQRDVGMVLGGLVVVLDTALLVATFAGGRGLSSLADSAPYLVAGNAAVAVMLWRARASISRVWVDDHSELIDPPWSGTWYPVP